MYNAFILQEQNNGYSIMARKTKEETEKTFHALLDAASVLFNQHGVAKTTLNEIAKHCGMTRGAVYWHFDNKDSLIMALWERGAGRFHQLFIDRLSQLPEEQSSEAFRQLLKNLLRLAFSDPTIKQVLRIVTSGLEFTDEASVLQRFLWERKNQFYDGLHQAFIQLNKQNALRINTSEIILTNSLWAYLTGIIHTQLEMDPDKVNIEDQTDELIDIHLNAILNNTTK